MKRLIFFPLFITLTLGLAFPREATLKTQRDISVRNEYNSHNLWGKGIEWQGGRFQSESDRERKISTSKRKTGKALIYIGAIATITGVSMIISSYKTVTTPTLRGGYFGTKTTYYNKNLRTPGIVLLSSGIAMITIGFILKKHGDYRKDYIGFSLNPLKAKAAISYRINF